jgi:scyllo-inosose 3-dehydrogenase
MQALVLDGTWSPSDSYDVSERERRTGTAMDGSSVWKHPKMRVEERSRPELAADEVLVRVRYVGICGSDLSMTATDEDGYMHYSAYVNLPNVVGHEFSGEVVETGADTRLFEAGDLVTGEVTDYCCRCRMCRQGFHGHCENFEQVGFTISGAMAEYVAVPEKILWDVSSLSRAYETRDEVLRAAATVEPSTICYYGMYGRAEGVVPGDYYVFHGAGPIGLTGMNVARAAGAGMVVAFEPSDERRAIARDLGFEHMYDPLDCDPVEAVRDATGGDGADVHVETSGAVTATYPVIEDTLAERANVVHISNAGSDPSVALRKYQGNAAQIYGSEGHTGQQVFPRVVRLMAAGQLDNLSLITSTFDLSDAEAAFDRARERVDGKVLIEV